MKRLLIQMSVVFLLVGAGVSYAHAQTSGTQTIPPCGTNCNLGYTPLEPIPGLLPSGNNLNFSTLLASIYKIAIVVGALFSVLMLTISGVRYMLSDVVTDKQRAKDRIKACLYGLVLIAASWLILNTINPQLVKFNLNPGTATVTGTAPPPGPTNPYQAIIVAQDKLNDTRNAKYDSTQCNAAQQRLNDSGAFNGASVQAAALNSKRLKGRADDGTLLTTEQKAALLDQIVQLNRQTEQDMAITASCADGK